MEVLALLLLWPFHQPKPQDDPMYNRVYRVDNAAGAKTFCRAHPYSWYVVGNTAPVLITPCTLTQEHSEKMRVLSCTYDYARHSKKMTTEQKVALVRGVGEGTARPPKSCLKHPRASKGESHEQ